MSINKMKAESKAIIFGRYYNQLYDSDGRNYCITGERIYNILCGERGKILLKPLSSISDDDAKLLGHKNAEEFLLIIKRHFILATELQALNQLGYATTQTVIEDGKVVNYTVDELVNEGTFKLD